LRPILDLDPHALELAAQPVRLGKVLGFSGCIARSDKLLNSRSIDTHREILETLLTQQAKE
jgi:hypothetical protein